MSRSSEMTNEKTFITNFIKIYRSHPALWQVNSKEYCDKTLKHEGYKRLLELYRLVEPHSTKKINNLKSSYRKEYKKTQMDPLYISSLWYFDLLLFTSISKKHSPRKRKNEEAANEDTDEHQVKETEQLMWERESNEDNTNILDSEFNDEDFKCDFKVSYSPQQEPETSGSYSPEYTTLTTKKFKINANFDIDTPPVETTEFLNNEAGLQAQYPPEDEFDVVGRNVAFKLRSLSKDKAILAEKLMMDVLFAAKMGTLNPQSALLLH